MNDQPKTYRITVEIPATLAVEDLSRAFEVIADAAHQWEQTFPQRIWDIFVGGSTLDYTIEEAFAARGEAMLKALAIAREMQSQLVSGPELGDVERIIAALEDL